MAFSLNRAQIIGNLPRDPEARTTNTGTNVTNFGVATNRSWNDQQGQRQEQTEFHNIVAFGRLAEVAAQYLVKGKKVYIEGRLQTREWEGQDGAKRQRTEIIMENMIMLDRAGQQGGGGAPFGGNTPADAGGSQPPAPSDEGEIQLENIPF